MSPDELRAHAEAVVADWPELTANQITTLRALLRPTPRAA